MPIKLANVVKGSRSPMSSEMVKGNIMAKPSLEEQLLAELADLREALQADGVDLEVVSVKEGVAELRLLVGPDACEECVMPKLHLEELILGEIGDKLASVNKVELEDPRVC